mgnify:CR=1 FL=1
MNLFSDYQKKFLNCLFKLDKKNIIKVPKDIKGLTVELPPKEHKSDISCNAAMILAKFNKRPPIEIANLIKEYFSKYFNEFESVNVANPGFLNIKFKIIFWENYLIKTIKLNNKYGAGRKTKKKYNIEFVSANPTGPLHVGHCRGAILGDALSNLLKFNGHSITKEYYVNDYGNQIDVFILSVYHRILEINKKKDFPTNLNLYPGDYIIDIAKKILKNKKIKNFDNLKNIYNKLSNETLKISLNMIKSNLDVLGIKHDNFVFETQLIKNKLVIDTINKLKKKNHVYMGKLAQPKGDEQKNWKERSQLLFCSTKFGDDTDRSLQKEDKTWTYFASDIAYHNYKIKRKYDVLINILGSDHAGYIKRISAAVNALSNNKTNFVCKVSQLVNLYKNGKPIKMSKRKGDYITVKDLIDDVGKDSVRFMMLNRNNDAALDFDYEKVTEKSKDNPVFYVQYAYARINSIFRILNLNLEKKIEINNKNIKLNNFEIEILKKISEWPKCVEIATNKLEPNRIPFYLNELATLFHSYWNLGKENQSFKFISEDKNFNNYRILLLQALAIVIKNGMTILGVSTPKRM